MKNSIFLLALALVFVVAACSSGGGDSSVESPKAEINKTTWDSLVWDDGNNDKTRNWAD
jgi:ABC-type glycerol-3-phosphate transport system substrate-binding protein